jgi:hypothetical protein
LTRPYTPAACRSPLEHERDAGIDLSAAARYADHLDRMATWAGDAKHISADMIRGLAGEVAALRARLAEAEAAVERAARLALERAEAAAVDAQAERCRSCGHPRNNHPYRHPFVGAAADAPAAIRAIDARAIAAEAKGGD